MLLADKNDLQNKLKLSMLQVEEKELNHYTVNAGTLGTQAALLAGFAFAIVVDGPWDIMMINTNSWVIGFSVCFTTIGLIFEIFAMLKSVQLSILGPKLALRGPEGVMSRAVMVMRWEEVRMHNFFYLGLVFFQGAVTLIMWGVFRAEIAIATTVLLMIGLVWMLTDARLLDRALKLPPRAAGVTNLWEYSMGSRTGLNSRRRAEVSNDIESQSPDIRPSQTARRLINGANIEGRTNDPRRTGLRGFKGEPRSIFRLGIRRRAPVRWFTRNIRSAPALEDENWAAGSRSDY